MKIAMIRQENATEVCKTCTLETFLEKIKHELKGKFISRLRDALPSMLLCGLCEEINLHCEIVNSNSVLKLAYGRIETPLQEMEVPKIAGKKVVDAITRSGCRYLLGFA